MPTTVGGLVGQAQSGLACVASSFWDVQSSGQTDSPGGGEGKTTAEMQDMQTYLKAGWDFVNENENGTCQIWQMPLGGGYPILATSGGYTPRQLQGTGTSDDPYLIFDAPDLGATFHYSRDAHYRLANSIDLSGIHWNATVIPWFSGVLDGDGHTISNLTVAGGGFLGLFGLLKPGATVENLGVVDVNVTGWWPHVGGLVGSNSGTVTQCYCTGVISGTGWIDSNVWVGGLVGSNSGTVTQCYCTGMVSGQNNNVGGLVGVNEGSVTKCYSTGGVRGYNGVGGLVGSNSGPVTQCYNTGSVSGDDYVGGLVGIDYATISACYNTGPVNGSRYVGGLVGLNYGPMLVCYSMGSVSGSNYVGGLVGYGGTSSACF